MSVAGSGFRLMDSYAEFTLDPAQFLAGVAQVTRSSDELMRSTERTFAQIAGEADKARDRMVSNAMALTKFENAAKQIPERIAQPWRAVAAQQTAVAMSGQAVGKAQMAAASGFGMLTQAIGGAINGIEGIDKAQKKILSGASEIAQSAIYGGLIGGSIGAAAMTATAAISVLFKGWAQGAAEAAAATANAADKLRALAAIGGASGQRASVLTGLVESSYESVDAMEAQKKLADKKRAELKAFTEFLAADAQQPASLRDYTDEEGTRAVRAMTGPVQAEEEKLRDAGVAVLREISERVQRTTGEAKVKALDDLIKTMSEFATSQEDRLNEAMDLFAPGGVDTAISEARAQRNRAAADVADEKAQKDFDKQQAERRKAKADEDAKRLKEQSSTMQKAIDSVFKEITDFAKGAADKQEQALKDAQKQAAEQAKDMIDQQDDLAKLLYPKEGKGGGFERQSMLDLEGAADAFQQQIFDAADPAKMTAENTSNILTKAAAIEEHVAKIATGNGKAAVFGP